jgi:hypothetical protein
MRRNLCHNSGELNSLNLNHCNLTVFFGFDTQSFESGSPEHAVVRSELHQLLPRVAGNGDLDHISFKDTKRISCALMKEI